jgi:hypothetical protein
VGDEARSTSTTLATAVVTHRLIQELGQPSSARASRNTQPLFGRTAAPGSCVVEPVVPLVSIAMASPFGETQTA